MSTAVLTAVGDSAVEAPLLAAFSRPAAAVTVVRRCVDVAELLAAATAGTATAALVSADLRRLDAGVVSRLTAAAVGVVGLAADEADERRLRGLGIARVLACDAPPSAVAAALAEAAATARTTDRADRGDHTDGAGRTEHVDRAAAARRAELADPADALALLAEAGLESRSIGGPDDGLDADPEPTGQVVAVWGPTGAPGRTLLAATLAAEAAVLGGDILLADADTYGGSVAQVLGLLDDAPGLAAAARAATLGTLDVPSLAGFARGVAVPGTGTLRVLTGLSRPDRWPELRPTALERVLALARRLCALTVVDCGFCLETDEELSYDTVAPRRNGATLAALAAADTVLAVGAADPVSLSRLVRALPELSAAAPAARVRVVVGRVRRGPVTGDPGREVAGVLARFAGVHDPLLLPEDRPGVDAALAAGRLLAETAPASAYRAGVVALAADLLGVAAGAPRRRRLSRSTR